VTIIPPAEINGIIRETGISPSKYRKHAHTSAI